MSSNVLLVTTPAVRPKSADRVLTRMNTAGEEDRFSGGGFSFAFERDDNGEVTGFRLSNVRTRDAGFGRAG